MKTKNKGRYAGKLGAAVGVLLLAVVGGCRDEPTPGGVSKLVVYCSVDETFARRILSIFRDRSGTDLAIVFDSEAGKTTGLVRKIISEAQAGRPRADVFWSSELFNTILLARRGLLEPYDSPSAADLPARFRDAQYRWTATSVRARVLAFDPKRTPRESVPTRWEDLAKPEHAARVAFANPLFGTTSGHVSAMFALWGGDGGRKFLRGLRDGGAHIADGNSSAVRSLIAGRVALAATDTDDVWVAQRSGASLDLVYPDLGDGGTLLIPCSVAIVAGTRSGDAARRLVDFLVSADVERMLARSGSRNVPVRKSLREELGMVWPAESRVDYDAVADSMDDAMTAAREILLR